MPRLAQTAPLHSQLETIHPFLTGEVHAGALRRYGARQMAGAIRGEEA